MAAEYSPFTVHGRIGKAVIEKTVETVEPSQDDEPRCHVDKLPLKIVKQICNLVAAPCNQSITKAIENPSYQYTQLRNLCLVSPNLRRIAEPLLRDLAQHVKLLGFICADQSSTHWTDLEPNEVVKLVPNLEELYIAGDHRWAIIEALEIPKAHIHMSVPTGIDGCSSGVEVMLFKHEPFQSRPELQRLRANILMANTRRLAIGLDRNGDQLPEVGRVLHYMPVLEALEITEVKQDAKVKLFSEIMRHLRPAAKSLKSVKIRTTRYWVDFNLLGHFRNLEYLELICPRRNVPKPDDHRFRKNWKGRPILPRRLKNLNLCTLEKDELALQAFVRTTQRRYQIHTKCDCIESNLLAIQLNDLTIRDEEDWTPESE
ncbi:Fc.00g007310.m01.CDS01 [Cosmosporella sp. VM-42]